MFRYVLLALKGCTWEWRMLSREYRAGRSPLFLGNLQRTDRVDQSFNPTALKLLSRFEFRRFWRHINGSFLFSRTAGYRYRHLFAGTVDDLPAGACPIEIWSFFSGLIVASAKTRRPGYSEVEPRRWDCLSAPALAFWIAIASRRKRPTTGGLSCSGIAICAMILPGISGAFILLLLGKYQYILQAVSEFPAGCPAAFRSRSRRRYHQFFAPAFVAAAQASRPDDLPAHGFHGRIAQ